MRNRIHLNNTGSALVMSLIGIALMGIFALAALTIFSGKQKDSVRAIASENNEALSQALSAIASDSQICLTGLDGAGPLPGISFLSATGAPTNFSTALAAPPNGQNIELGSNILNPGSTTPVTIRAGTVLNNFNLRVDRLYAINNGQITGPTVAANTFSITLYIQSTNTTTNTSYGVRKIADVAIQVDPVTSALVGCTGQQGAQQICQNMNCTWVAGSIDQKCQCQLPDMSCGAGQYISGYDPVTLRPTCTNISVTCNPPSPQAGRGPGYFMAGVDISGQPICVAMAPIAAAPPPIGGCSNPSIKVCGPGKCKSNNLGAMAAIAITSFASYPPASGNCNGSIDVNGTNQAFALSCKDTSPQSGTCVASQTFSVAGGNFTVDLDIGTGLSSQSGPTVYTCTITCAAAPPPAPVAGACGPANGGTYIDAATTTAAGLCNTGTPSVALTDPGPWNWTCNGANGGANSLGCSANQTAGVQVTCMCDVGGPAHGGIVRVRNRPTCLTAAQYNTGGNFESWLANPMLPQPGTCWGAGGGAGGAAQVPCGSPLALYQMQIAPGCYTGTANGMGVCNYPGPVMFASSNSPSYVPGIIQSAATYISNGLCSTGTPSFAPNLQGTLPGFHWTCNASAINTPCRVICPVSTSSPQWEPGSMGFTCPPGMTQQTNMRPSTGTCYFTCI